MAKSRQQKSRRAGCAVIAVAAVAAVAAVVGVGLYLGKKDAASKTPCERYAEVVTRELSNCHSGVTQNHAHHVEICERSVAPTSACLKAIEELSCQQLEQGPVAFAEACQKGR